MIRKPGRPSAASLTLVPLTPRTRPAPPKELTRDEREIWIATVASVPADWFTPDSWPLLVAYCRHAVMASRLSGQIAKTQAAAMNPGDPGALVLLDKLLKMRDRETKAVNTFARSMRLTQQGRFRRETAGSRHDSGGPSVKPWQ